MTVTHGTQRPSTTEVIDALAPFASLPDWLAAGMLADCVESALATDVPELRDGRLRLVSCKPERLRAKEDQWLARYSVVVAEPGGPQRSVVLVGHLRPPTEEIDPRLAAGPSALRFGDPGWRAWLPELRLDLVVQEADEALPALPELVDPRACGRLIQDALRSAGYAEAVVVDCAPNVVRYKPGSRCTIVVRVSYAGGPLADERSLPDPVVVKTHQGDKGRVAWEAMSALWATPLADGEIVRIAEPLTYLPETRVLVQGPVAEQRILKDLARQALSAVAEETPDSTALLDELRDALTRTAAGLAALHGSGVSYGRVATFAEELAEVDGVVDRLARSVPELAPAAAPLLTLLADLARRVPDEAPVPAHHDFRPAQVLLAEGGIGFIDFDGACMAEPGLDLGRFRAKLRDIGIHALLTGDQPCPPARLQAGLATLDDLCEHFLTAYQVRGDVARERVLLWETCDLLTSMLHAWTQVRLARIGPRMQVLTGQLRRLGNAA